MVFLWSLPYIVWQILKRKSSMMCEGPESTQLKTGSHIRLQSKNLPEVTAVEGNQKFRHIFFPFLWKQLTWTQNGLHSGDMSHCELPLTLPVATATVKRCHVEKIRLPHTKRHNGRTLLFSMESFWAFVESCPRRKGDLTAGKLNIKRCARGAVFTSDLYVKTNAHIEYWTK